MDLQLYLPEKYKVIAGTFSNVAVCTCWTDPEGINKLNPELIQNCQLVGTLYSREGVSIMLRNLALNPWIDTVLLYAKSPLSQTQIGAAGRRMLQTIWEKRKVHEQLIQKEIDQSVISTVAKNVRLIDVSDIPLDDFHKTIQLHRKKTPQNYMKRVDFPEARRDEDAPWPSENTGFVVRGKTLVNAWSWAIDRIIRYGHVTTTKYGSKQREVQNLTWVIENESIDDFYMPDWPENVLSHVGLSKEQRDDYKKTYLDGTAPQDINYTYGSRLRAYQGDLDQIENIIEKIKKYDAPRNAYAVTTYPPLDLFQSSPCLTQVQVLIGEEGEINLFCVFRSHDMMKAALLNAYGLLYLQNYIALKTKKKSGTLTITSQSAHMYEEDWRMAKDIVSCSLWGRVRPYFDEKEDLDPRGYVRISLKGEKIYIELVSPDGNQLADFLGDSARQVALHIAKLRLLSLSDHYCDMAIELTKAEIAAKTGKVYIQDRPLQVASALIK